MRYALAALLLMALPVFAQTPPAKPKTMVEHETAEFKKFQDAVPAGLPQIALDYWQRRLDLALDLDLGKMTPEAWIQARLAVDTMFNARLDAEYKKLQAEQAAADRANRAAAEADRRQFMFDLGTRLLSPPRTSCVLVGTPPYQRMDCR